VSFLEKEMALYFLFGQEKQRGIFESFYLLFFCKRGIEGRVSGKLFLSFSLMVFFFSLSLSLFFFFPLTERELQREECFCFLFFVFSVHEKREKPREEELERVLESGSGFGLLDVKQMRFERVLKLSFCAGQENKGREISGVLCCTPAATALKRNKEEGQLPCKRKAREEERRAICHWRTRKEKKK